jgi:adenosine deaminase
MEEVDPEQGGQMPDKFEEDLDVFNDIRKTILQEKGDNHWIQKAVSKNPGSLHKALGVPQDKKIPAKKLKIKSTDSDLMKKRKTLAKTLKKMRHEWLENGNINSLSECFDTITSLSLTEAAESQLATKLITVVAILAATRAMTQYSRELIKTNSEIYCQNVWNDEKLYKICRENFKLKQLQKEIQILQQAKSKCSKTNDSEKCKTKINEKIQKVNAKISLCKFNITNFKKLPSLPRSSSSAGSATFTAGDLEVSF